MQTSVLIVHDDRPADPGAEPMLRTYFCVDVELMGFYLRDGEADDSADPRIMVLVVQLPNGQMLKMTVDVPGNEIETFGRSAVRVVMNLLPHGQSAPASSIFVGVVTGGEPSDLRHYRAYSASIAE